MKCSLPGRRWLRAATLAFVAGLSLLPIGLFAGAADEPMSDRPMVALNADGHPEAFKINADGELRHRWRAEATWDWSSWSSLGGAVLPGAGAATNVAGQLMVFAVDQSSKALKVIQQKVPNGHEWLEWTNLGGAIRPPVTVTRMQDGRLEVFAVSADGGSVRHIWQKDAAGAWSGWSDLGGALEPGLAAARNKDGRLEIFGVNAADKSLSHCRQQVADDESSWPGWSSLGGKILPGLVAGQNADGRLEVLAVNGENGGVDFIYQTTTAGDSWSDWSSLRGNVKPGLALGQSANGRLEVFGVDQGDSSLLHSYELKPDSSANWSPWQSMGGNAQPYPAVIYNRDDTLQVFVADRKNPETFRHRRQIAPNTDWLDWSDLEHRSLPYISRTWQTDEGLPHNQVEAIAQTQDGYLWVGTSEGLARFDGAQFTVFDAKNTPELHNAFISALCADREGALWIGTYNGLLCLKDGVFSHYGKDDGLAGNAVGAIYERRDGSIWIGTSTGLSQYKDGKFSNYTKARGLVSDFVNALCEDRTGSLWIGTAGGLNRLKGSTIDTFTTANGLPSNVIRGIWQDRDGKLWLSSNNGIISYSKGRFVPYNNRQGLADNFASAALEDHLGTFWVGTFSGLSRFPEGRFFSEFRRDGVPYDQINTLFEDRQGDLWAGSREGLIQLAPKRFFAFTKQQGLTHNNVTSVREDRKGNLWVGTAGGGLDELKNGEVTAFTTNNGFPQDVILATCESRDGSIWAGADAGGGLLHLQAGKITRYASEDGLGEAAPRVIHEDQAGNLWIGSNRGLTCFKDGKFTHYSTNQYLAGEVVRAICEDQEGAIWFGTDDGLSCLKNGKFRSFTTRDGLSGNLIAALYADADNNLWIGTDNAGLNRYKNGRFTAATMRQGLFSNEIFEILEDNHRWLWLSCTRGIFRVRKADLEALDQGRQKNIACIAYDKTDGMESAQCNGVAKPAGWKARDGRLWFPTILGLVAVDPDIKINETAPPVFIEQFYSDKKPLLRGGLAVLNPAKLTLAGGRARAVSNAPVQIAPGHGELEINYTAICFQAPEKCRFKYKLEGVDSDWIDAGPRRSAHYNNINPGNYRFRVMACNNEGVWNEAGASLLFNLQPHVWQTWWFRGLLALTAFGLVGGTARYVTRNKMQKTVEQLEQQHAIEKERGRIAQDIHDDLGSSLTRIMMLGERVEEGMANREDVGVHIRKIVDSARDTVKSLDEIIWAVNPENDTLDSLIEYITHYVDEFFESTDVSCRLEMPVEIGGFILPAEVRHDLFLAVKEALNNVLKHSQAKEVRVRVSEAAAWLTIAIEDNGRGFERDGAGAAGKGHGLENMRKRIEELNGKMEIVSAPGGGTKLKFVVKLKLKPATR